MTKNSSTFPFDFATGNDFAIAVSKYLGLDPALVSAARLNSELNEPLALTITYVVDRTDLGSIVSMMAPT